MRLPIYQVDAFTDRLFAGNPAAVVPLETWLPDDRLQAIAAENNLAETAFFVPAEDGYEIRWFTPTVEMDLCGHATLAAAFVIANRHDRSRERMEFRSPISGPLAVTREEDLYTLDFPVRLPQRVETPDPKLVPALGGVWPMEILATHDYYVVLEDEAAVRALKPDLARLARLDRLCVCVTAPARDGMGDGVDFVSRLFAPGQGIPEDPVTGSSHCTLIPYWAQRLGKTRLNARQVSARGGSLTCELAGDRVRIGGRAVLYLEGHIFV